MNMLLTVAIVIVCGLALWFGISAIIKIWQQSVEIGEFVDDKDGNQGKRAQAIIDFILREAPEIHRKADLSAISVGPKLEVPMVGRRDPGLERIESLDIKVKDLQLNWVFAILRALAKPSCEVNGRIKLGQASTEIVVEMTDSSIRDTPIIVSVPHTTDANNDTEQAATAAAYELLHAMYQHFAKDKSRVPGNWISLERFTEGLRELQAYRLAVRSGEAGDGQIAQDHLTTAIAKLEQVRQIDPGYNDGLYYLGVAYFERRGLESKAIKVFEELLSRNPAQAFEARFYLGYAWFRTYTLSGMEKALAEYYKLKIELESRLWTALPPDEKKWTRGLFAETFAQIANTHANLLHQLRGPMCDDEKAATQRELAKEQYNRTVEYAAYAEKEATENGKEISLEILEDVQWRRLNALGYAEFNFACFDERNKDKYREHCDKALKYYDQALQKSPLNYNTLQNKGELYRDISYSERNLKLAEQLFLQSADLKPSDDYARERLGMIYDAFWQQSHHADDKEKMIEYYKQAAQLGSERSQRRLAELGIPVKGKTDEAKPKATKTKHRTRRRHHP